MRRFFSYSTRCSPHISPMKSLTVSPISLCESKIGWRVEESAASKTKSSSSTTRWRWNQWWNDFYVFHEKALKMIPTESKKNCSRPGTTESSCSTLLDDSMTLLCDQKLFPFDNEAYRMTRFFIFFQFDFSLSRFIIMLTLFSVTRAHIALCGGGKSAFSRHDAFCCFKRKNIDKFLCTWNNIMREAH